MCDAEITICMALCVGQRLGIHKWPSGNDICRCEEHVEWMNLRRCESMRLYIRGDTSRGSHMSRHDHLPAFERQYMEAQRHH